MVITIVLFCGMNTILIVPIYHQVFGPVDEASSNLLVMSQESVSEVDYPFIEFDFLACSACATCSILEEMGNLFSIYVL